MNLLLKPTQILHTGVTGMGEASRCICFTGQSNRVTGVRQLCAKSIHIRPGHLYRIRISISLSLTT